MDRGSAVIFDADSGLCLSHLRTLGPKRNLDHKSFFSLDRYIVEFIKIISFFETSSFKLRCETVYWNCTVLLSSSMLPSLLFGRN